MDLYTAIQKQASKEQIETIFLETSKCEYPDHQVNNLIMGSVFFHGNSSPYL